MSEPTRLRVGILGAGRRGRDHIRSILALPDLYQLVGVCDVSEAAASAAAALGATESYTRPRDFLSRIHPDAVVITTPRETHHLVVQLVASYECGMLLETPLATTRAMMDVIAEIDARGKHRIEVAEQMWRRPAEHLNRQAIAAGLIGQVRRVTSFYGPAGGNSCYHTMSLMRSYAGANVAEVDGVTQRIKSDGSGELWTQGVLRYANGVVGSITYTSNWTGPLRRGHPRFFSVEGTEGFIITGDCPGHMLRRVQNGKARDYPKRIEPSDGPVELERLFYETDPIVEYRNPFAGRMADDREPRQLYDEMARAAELVSLHRSITTGASPDYTVAQARRDMELSIILAEAARRREPLVAKSAAVGPETEWEREQHEAFRTVYGADPIRDADRLISDLG